MKRLTNVLRFDRARSQRDRRYLVELDSLGPTPAFEYAMWLVAPR